MEKATLDQAAKILDLFGNAPKDQIQNILGSGFLADLRDGDIAGVKRNEFRRILGLKSLSPPPLLKLLYTTTLPAIAGDFIAKERFAVNTSEEDAEVKISGRGSNFVDWFGDVVEEPIGESELNVQVQQLQKSSVDRPIIDELGGSEKAGIFLQQIYFLMGKLQAEDETDGWFVGYKEDKVRFPEDKPFAYTNKKGGRSVLRAVDFSWHGGGWFLHANLVSDPIDWRSGCLFLSGNSLAA